jgi:cell wall assembly regulator SMI1
MELIALRDIQPNEEILCDYGAKWESAWKKHVDNWRPTAGSENYPTAKELIDTTGILTIEEQKENAYPNDVRTACHFAHSQDTVYQNVAGDEDLMALHPKAIS